MNKKVNRIPLMIFILLVIILIALFWKYVLIAVGVILGLIVVYCLLKRLFHYKNYKKLKKDYEDTFYFKEKRIPFKEIYQDKGQPFMIECYERIRTKIGTDYKVLTHLNIPKVEIENDYIDIDFIFFHHTGIYVLEVIDYKGDVYGNKEDITWRVKRKNRKKKEEIIEFSNPIQKNLDRIINLKNIINYNYSGYIIVSDQMIFNQPFDHVVEINQFIDIIKNKPIQYYEDLHRIDEIYNNLKQYEK